VWRAANFNPNATYQPPGDAGSCTFAIRGCTDSTAANYLSGALVDDGSCAYAEPAGCLVPQAVNFNTSARALLPGSCVFPLYGCLDSAAYNYVSAATASNVSQCLYLGCTDAGDANYDSSATTLDGSCASLSTRRTLAEANVTSNSTSPPSSPPPRPPPPPSTLQSPPPMPPQSPAPPAGGGGGPSSPPLVGCTVESATNYDSVAGPAFAWDDGSCTFALHGCTDTGAVNYASEVAVDDGTCIFAGCTDPGSAEYDSRATVHPGGSACPSRACAQYDAVNFVPGAVEDDGSCEFPGCVDPEATNFDSAATSSDGSCTFPVRGCTDPNAENYASQAEVDDGTCQRPGCVDPMAANYDSRAAFDDGRCSFPAPPPPEPPYRPPRPPSPPSLPPGVYAIAVLGEADEAEEETDEGNRTAANTTASSTGLFPFVGETLSPRAVLFLGSVGGSFTLCALISCCALALCTYVQHRRRLMMRRSEAEPEAAMEVALSQVSDGSLEDRAWDLGSEESPRGSLAAHRGDMFAARRHSSQRASNSERPMRFTTVGPASGGRAEDGKPVARSTSVMGLFSRTPTQVLPRQSTISTKSAR